MRPTCAGDVWVIVLREAELDGGQGYLLSRPLTADQLHRLLANGRSLLP